MAQARTLIEQAAGELYPGTCAKIAAGLAWATVGVGAAPIDAVPPTASITSPATGTRVTAGFQVQATAADDQCIQKVELLIDGAVAQTLTAAPFTFTTDAGLASGMHTIQVKSYDVFNQGTANAMVTVGGGTGTGTGTGDDDGNDVTGGCNTGGGAGLGLGLGLLGLVRRRRR